MKKALVIKLRNLGDTLLATPLFSELKKVGIEADAYVYKESVPLLEDNPYISEIISYDKMKKGCQQEFSILKKIRDNRYDIVINLTEGDRGAIAAKISGAPIRVGFDPEGRGFFCKKSFYTHIIKNCPSPRHSVEKNLDALRHLGIVPTEKKLFFHVPEEIKNKVEIRDFILIHIASRWKFKCWSGFKELSRVLIKRGEKLLFTSGPDPVEIVMVNDLTSDLPDVQNLAGKISLKELGALISLSKLLICVDSLPLHMASALKARAIALFGPTSEIVWGPWQNPNIKVLKEDLACRPCLRDGCGGSKISECLNLISVEKVVNYIENSSPK